MNDKKDLALEAVLLFHGGGPWTDDNRQRWQVICAEVLGRPSDYANREREKTQFGAAGWDATTKTLCDIVRAAQKV